MLVAVRAYEGMYQGLHGIEEIDILDVNDVSEVNDWGDACSNQLIESYGLEDEYLEDSEDGTIEGSSCYCDRGWEAHKVKEDTGLNIEDLLSILNDELGYDEFVKKYCEKEYLDLG